MENIHGQLQIYKSQSRILIGIYGIPGSGKSTLASKLHSSLADSVLVPMDGFHYTLKELQEFPDPKEALDRRGSPFTFNSQAFLELLVKIKSGEHVIAPSFNHQKKDPVCDIKVNDQRLVIVEGLYLGLNSGNWIKIQELFDFTIMIEIDVDVAMERVFKRHCTYMDEEEAKRRIEGNDRLNAAYVLENSCQPTILLPTEDIKL